MNPSALRQSKYLAAGNFFMDILSYVDKKILLKELIFIKIYYLAKFYILNLKYYKNITNVKFMLQIEKTIYKGIKKW